MRAFDHVIVLLSFVYALALTHLLARIVSLYDARERVTFSWLQALMALNAILLVFGDWLALWPLRLVSSWDYLSIADNFLLAVLLFFTCAIAAPERSEGPIDLAGYYWHARKPFYGLCILGNVVAMLGNLDFLKSADPALFWTWTAAASAAFIPWLLPLASRAPWAQWAGAILFTMYVLGLGIAISNLR